MVRPMLDYENLFVWTTEDGDIEVRSNRVKETVAALKNRLVTKVKKAITIRNIANVTFILGVSLICLQQCYSALEYYLKFTTKIQVSHVFPSSTLWLLPGVTICNNNRVRLSKLMEMATNLEDKFNSSIFKETEISQYPAKRRFELMRAVKKLVDESVNLSSIINESTISELVELSRTPMIKDVNCNALWGQQFNCENFRIVESFQASPCYTLFFLGSLLEALANGSAYDFESSLLGGERKNESFANNEVAEIIIDFEPLQHADFYRDIGGKMVIHSTGHVGSIRDMAHSILPGNKYDIIIRRSMSRRLPPPYTSMCHDYKKEHSALFATNDTKPSVALDKTTCTRNCVVQRTTKACNCWPVEVPYYPEDNLIENSTEYKMCSWGFEEGQKNHSAASYVDCYHQFHSQCREACRHGCRTEDYKVSVLSEPWPADFKFYKATSDEARRKLQKTKNCCALISLKYPEFMENRHIMYPSMTLAELVSSIGGIVSALVGVSSVTIYRYITRRVLRCKVVRDYNITDKAPMPKIRSLSK